MKEFNEAVGDCRKSLYMEESPNGRVLGSSMISPQSVHSLEFQTSFHIQRYPSTEPGEIAIVRIYGFQEMI
jgi:hypothetical protein